jgi:hypothetical protein
VTKEAAHPYTQTPKPPLTVRFQVRNTTTAKAHLLSYHSFYAATANFVKEKHMEKSYSLFSTDLPS